MSVAHDDAPSPALVAIEAAVREAVATTLATSDVLGITPLEAAFREARDFLAEATGAPRDAVDELIPA
jgi:hypothetical protein